MATKKDFLSLPAELRNDIYSLTMAGFEENLVEARNVKSTNRRSRDAARFNFALDLSRTFPFLLTSKTILSEAFGMCLNTCTVHFASISDMAAMLYAQDHSDLAELTHHIRAVSLDATHKRRHHWDDAFKLTSVVAVLHSFFANAELLCIHLDEFTMEIHVELTEILRGVNWPALLDARVRRPDLEKRLLKIRRRRALGSPSNLSGDRPSALDSDWLLDMELLRLQRANRNLRMALRNGKSTESEQQL
jgi:hypothetical protein